VLLFSLVLPAGVAQERGLYGAAAPEDAAFVRCVNVSNSGVAGVPIGATSFGPLEAGAVSPYRPVGPGIYLLGRVGSQQELIATEGTYYTVALGGETITVLEDERHEDAARAQIIFYNLTPDRTLSLRTSDGEIELVGAIAAGASGSVVVNPIRVALAVFDGDGGQSVAEPEPLSLDSGQSYGVFVFGHAPDVQVQRARIETE
jgi:hypothetical protein